MTTIFKTISDGPFTKNNEEVDEVKIVPLSEVKNVAGEFYPATIQILQEVGIL